MDNRRFDNWARQFAGTSSRRKTVRGLLGLVGLAVLSRFAQPDASARRGSSGAGDPCRHDGQCGWGLVCAWNGYGHDSDYNCCGFQGSNCWDGGDCCGLSECLGGFCGPDPSGSVSVSGSGGVATADASGGAIYIGDVDSGGNVGNIVDVGDTRGNVSVSGGYVSNETDVSVAAQGGTAISDASGGSYNVAGGGPYYGAWGDPCPGWCDFGSTCSGCNSGYCTWGGYCG